MRWYKHDPDAFLAGVQQLTLEERGAYITLIDLLYARDGDVPDDDRLMARQCGCDPRTWRRLRERLIADGKVWTGGGKLHARRVDAELNSARRLVEAMSKLGRRSGEARAQMAEKLRQLNGPPSTGSFNGPVQTTRYKNKPSLSSETEPAREEPAQPPQAGGRSTEIAISSELDAVMQRKLRS